MQMNIYDAGLILSNETQMTRILNFHPHFRATVIWRIFYKIYDEKCSSCRLVQQGLNVTYKPAYFGQCSCCINIDINNYPEEAELDTKPILAVVRTLILSTGKRSFWHFPPSLVTTPRF